LLWSHDQNVPGNIGEASPAGYTLVQGPGGVTTSPTFLGPIWVWSQQTF